MSKICDNKMTFQECELAILRQAVDKAEEIAAVRVVFPWSTCPIVPMFTCGF